ncbi:hypothetical protein SEUCBS139899_009472 [Sporothrix eucalyptigena]|uniref:Transglutaminase-like domain-containing protein n=1 Tax=Sporothrix eucalyptigena TaxID=1812306 RepID=A0ABP0CVM6_9PEZI
MPSLSLLKRSGRDNSPWATRTWNDNSDGLVQAPETAPRTASMPVPARRTGAVSTLAEEGYNSSGTDLHSVSTSASIPSMSLPSNVRKDRRDSKRDLFHGLISRSIRGAGRALSTSTPPPPSPSQSGSSSSLVSPTSATTAANAPFPISPPPSLSSSSFRTRQPAPAAAPPAPQRLLRSRPRQSSAATTHSATSAGSKTFSSSPPHPRVASSETTPILSDPSRSTFVNANKPLPSPPPEQDIDLPAKPVLKLARIMASLTDDDIEKLFSGAPQYFARSEGHFTGAPHPSVAYPWDESLEIRDLTDHVQIEDPAWSNVTAWPHITRRCSSESVATSISCIGADPAPPTPLLSAASTPVPSASASSIKSTQSTIPKKRSHFYPRSRERPSMLSIQGLEKGTIGYEAALELAVSDSLQEEQYGFDNLGCRPNAVTEARKNLMDPIAAAAAAQAAAKAAVAGEANAIDENGNGVKYVGETQILEELIKNGKRYADGSFYVPHQSKEFYNELFHHILRPPSKRPRSSSGQHRRSGSHASGGSDLDADLIPQIEALLDVLATPNVWIDFSRVEWRLRLGQILWASSPQDEFDPGLGCAQDSDSGTATPPRPATVDERYTERYWLLLQILLSTELLLRLDAITDGDEYGLEYVRPTEVHRFEKVANPSVRWSLMLARAWLENIDVVRIDEEEENAKSAAVEQLEKTKEKLSKASSSPDRPSSRASNSSGSRSKREAGLRHTVGWITTLTKKLSLIEGRLHLSKAPEKKYVYAMRAKHAPRQYRGVAHFAQELKWPNDLIGLMSQRALDADRLREPLNTKITETPTPRDSSSSVLPPPTIKEKLEFSRRLPRRRKVVAGLHPGGWLSRSYLSGLMLPGDGLCNLLMSTLLEGDDEALKSLGPVAHLGAGFVYSGKSFWSTACVVGRVLAAGAGAAECMGWVSSDVLPRNVGEGWVNIDADDVAEDMRMTNRRARIWGKAAVERESSVLGDADPEMVLPADFVIPYEAVYKQVPPQNTRIELQRFQLYSLQDPNRPLQKPGDGSIQPAERHADDGASITSVSCDTGGAGEAAGTTRWRAEPYAAETTFVVSTDGGAERVLKYNLSYDIYFVTAHPCVPSQRVKVVKSPSSPTIQQIDVTGDGAAAARSSTIHVTGHPLHKYYKYASIHLTTLIDNPNKSLQELLKEFAATTNQSSAAAAAAASNAGPTQITDNSVLVIDCITGFQPQPAAHEMPMSPVVDRKHNAFNFDGSAISSFPPLTKEISPIVALSPEIVAMSPTSSSASPAPPPHIASCIAQPPATPTKSVSPAPSSNNMAPVAASKMHHETRRRRFGSDMEILVRALCAERGWNALISRRRRGCLACAIREAGALGWRVVIRVD